MSRSQFERVQQRGRSGLSAGVITVEHTAASGMNVLGQVVEVQATSLELPLGIVQLRWNPTRAIHVRDPFIRFEEFQSCRVATTRRRLDDARG